MYVGAQVGTWSYFIQYVQDSVHAPERVAGYFLTGTLAGFGIGRFASAFLMRWIRADKLMGIYAIVNMVLVAIGVLHPCLLYTSRWRRQCSGCLPGCSHSIGSPHRGCRN